MMLDKRITSAVAAIPLLLFFVIFGGVIFKIGVTLVTAISIYEYISAYKATKHVIIVWVLVIGFILSTVAIFSNTINSTALPIVYAVVILSMAMPIFNKKYNVLSSALTITGYIYIVVFFSLLILIRDNPGGGYALIWLVFIIAWCCDTFAYYSGRLFGKRKLCPDVSPKKTVEGSIGGIAGSVVGVTIWGIVCKNIAFNWPGLIVLGILGGVVSQIGDLSASLIKRYVGIKDYGYIMPGHGGILDRFDSILFTVPVVYYYIIMFIG